MRVEIWAEVTCPWCGLGSHRLDRAVQQFRLEHGTRIEVLHRSFPLSSAFPADRTIGVRAALLRQHGVSGAQAEVSTRRIEALAEAEGLSPYRVLDNRVGNTDLAHEFLAHATTEGCNRAAWDAIFRAYFGQARPVFALDDLLDLGEELGLDRAETRRALTERRHRPQVQDELARARRLGAAGAPFILVDGKFGVAGAHTSDSLLDTLRRAWDESHPAAVDDPAEGPCAGPTAALYPPITTDRTAR
ncbi:DsbA family oxidoreductase [Nocardia cerradoensis]|uniref:DsbA family oxidoreductase n=1 Tax=Nocardia cerradoensis TaxID=85688 RepID=UPI0007C7BAF7|nr:DsbA family protein [Nocardia cerradoensis]NKY45498.1 DsbA family oxidoreductase [Nocardia cerradoensis]